MGRSRAAGASADASAVGLAMARPARTVRRVNENFILTTVVEF